MRAHLPLPLPGLPHARAGADAGPGLRLCPCGLNDALRARSVAWATGERITDTEVQRRVVTLAKTTPERAWLGEVASVALVQACGDARRAYRNWFGSLSGTRKGRRVGHPRFRSRKDNRQSIALPAMAS